MYAQAGQYDQSLQVAKINKFDDDSRARVLTEIANQYARSGQKVKAEPFLAQALQLAKADDTLSEVALKYARLGQKDKAEQILARIFQRAKQEYGLSQVEALAGVAAKYAEVGQKAKALEIMSKRGNMTQPW
jgi:tetratricopeptide (TPR) repeat protein